MATILHANFAFKDADGDIGTVKSLTTADITLLNNALQDIENLKLSIEDPAPTGFMGLWGDDTVPSGWLLCNGAAVSRTTYAGLFAKIGTRYGAGDGSSTFNLPDMRDRYPIGVGTNTLATKIAEQLPNIKGDLNTSRAGVDSTYSEMGAGLVDTSGAISPYYRNQQALGGTGSYEFLSGFAFNASSSNSIYTDSGKVYPLSLALNFIIKA